MRKILAIIMGVFGFSNIASNAQDAIKVDPATILFSVPTLASEIGELEAVETVSDVDFVMHEDEWRQVEFYPTSRLAEIRTMLHELKLSENQHRKPSGWTEVFMRRVDASPVLSGVTAFDDLLETLEAKRGSAPILYYGHNTVSGRVTNGFSLPIDSGLILYGMTDDEGVQVLGASVNGGDQALTKVFSTLNGLNQLVLVDWRSQMLLTNITSTGNLEVWRP